MTTTPTPEQLAALPDPATFLHSDSESYGWTDENGAQHVVQTAAGALTQLVETKEAPHEL